MIGSLIGLLFGGRLQTRHTETLIRGLAIVIVIIGIMPAIQTNSILTVIVCLVLGTVFGEILDIERRLDTLGNWLKKRFAHGLSDSTFTEGFVTASLLMCIGSMAVMGSLEAGINHNYAIIFSKSVIDGIMSITFAATLGAGVAFAALPVFVYQGAITLLATFLAPYLSSGVVTEMSAVGGILLIATGINTLGICQERIKVGNMLPAILLPIIYMPVTNWLASLF